MSDYEEGWDAGTWEGARRAQLRRALRLTVRERLEALEALAETGRRLAGAASGEMPRQRPGQRPRSPDRGAG